MENKYYTPDIEEFHVGFEYEFHSMSTGGLAVIDFGSEEIVQTSEPNIKIWNKEVLDEKTNPLYPNRSLPDIKKLIDNKQIRVKYLDREDIESFGFRFIKEMDDEQIYQSHIKNESSGKNCWYELIIEYINEFPSVIHIEYWYENETKYGNSTMIKLFEGHIKNKSELRRLLIQLNIIE